MRNLISRFGLALVGLGFMGTFAHAQVYNLSSQVTYTGRQTGAVWVVASTSPTTLYTNFMTRLSATTGVPFTNVAVTVSNLIPNVNYYLFAWRDTDGSGAPGVMEAQAWHPERPILMTSDRTVASFTITDPDNDADGLPDFWEANFGLPTQPGSGSSGALTLQRGETAFPDTLWASVVGNNPAGQATLNIATNRGFAPNDLVLITTMQDPNTTWALNKAGTFEFARIASASSNTLTLRSNRLNAFTVSTTEKIQVLKVPEYTEVNLAGSGLQFDGVNDYVQSQSTIPLDNRSFTIEAWAKRDRVAIDEFFLGQGVTKAENKALHFGFRVNNKFTFAFWANDLDTSATYTDTNWHHWAGTYDVNGRARRIFRDGVLVASDTASANYMGTGLLRIGNNSFGEFPIAGQIDEVRIWNVARSQEDIQADMNRSLIGTEANLVAYYRFDEGAGLTAYDASPNHRDATLMNEPAWVAAGGSTLTCQPWNGTNGGVLAFLAHQVTLGSGSVISADGKGYRGGDGVPSEGNYEWGMAGERTTGFSTAREGNSGERPQGGGGAGKGADGSGGGGCYASPGTNGAYALSGALGGNGATTLFGQANLSRLYLGGGGGGSGSHNAGRIGVGGGSGGGPVFVVAGAIQGNGTISSRGAAGQAGVYAADLNSGSGAGGGAGGSVFLMGNVANSLTVRATGGAGGARDPLATNSKNGGAGGVGRIRLDLPPGAVVPSNTLPTAGYTNQSLAGLSLLPGGDAYDSDLDGLSDLTEYLLHTSPVNPDTDGDTLPDKWEKDYGLNPLFASDAAADQDADGDHVCNLLEFHRGTRPDLKDTDGDGLWDDAELFVYHTDPLKADTDGDGISDSAEVGAGSDPLFGGTQYFYDPLDRLVGAEYENGLALGYEYDRNNNLVRQVYLRHDATTNNLPDAWEFIHGLTNNTSGFTDTDGDDWSDYQEWQAGTDPRNPNSHPDLTGSAGTSVASLAWPFTPSNFVVGVGQLDGLGAESIVIGADGSPGTTTNFLLVLTQTNSSWSTQRVDIGPFGVTSIAVGQPANRPGPAIYVGLRPASGAGKVVEFTQVGGVWTSNNIATSTGNAAFVLGVRPGRDVLVSLGAASPFGDPGTPYYLTFAANVWTLTRATTYLSNQRGLGTVSLPGLHGQASRGVRLVDAGGLQVLGDEGFVPTSNVVWDADYFRWFFLTPNKQTWDASQTYARQFGGNLATVTDGILNQRLMDSFLGKAEPTVCGYWIGLSRASCSSSCLDCPPPWQWASGLPFAFGATRSTYPWRSGEWNCAGNNETVVHVWTVSGSSGWNDIPRDFTAYGLVELNINGPTVSANEPPASRRLLWRGHSLNAGNLRLTNAVSILYTFVDDKNLNNVMDAGDELVLAEYLFNASAVTLNDLQHIPLSGASLAQSYGLASVDVLYGNQQVFFTAEPDGRVFSWSATNATAPLQRQLFSASTQHVGKAWHALAGVRATDAGQNLLGLRVDPTAPSRCDVILWPPQSQLWSPTEVPQTAPITQILPTPASGRDVARVDIRIWDAEGGTAMPQLEYQRTVESAWSSATIAVSGAVDGYVASSPIGLTNQVLWDAARDLGQGFANTVTLRARAHDNTLTGDWSPPVFYHVTNSLTISVWATNDIATTAQGTPVNIDVLANDTVSGGLPKLIASVGAPGHGTAVTNANQTVRYTPAPGFTNTDQFTYTLTDGAGSFSMATVTVTVTAGAPAVIVLASPAWQGGNQFSMTIWGSPGQVYQVQASTNLTSWSDVRKLTNVTGDVLFTEQVPANTPARFYRAMQVP